MTFRARHYLLVLSIFLVVWGLPACGTGSSSGGDKISDSGGYPPPPQAIRTASIDLTDGTTYKIEDQKGKVILVNLWAIWCGPCREEMPELVKLQKKFGPKGFEIVGLDVDPEDTIDRIGPFAEKMGINYKLGMIEEELVMAFFDISGRNGIPQSFLINREGKLTGVFFGGGQGTIDKVKEQVEKVVTSQ